MAKQKETHHGKAYIIYTERIKPERLMIKSKAKLKNSEQSIPKKRAVKRYVHAQPRILSPSYEVLVFLSELLENFLSS